MALTQDRDTKQRDGKTFHAPLAAGVTIYAGAQVARDALGNLVPGSVATTLAKPGRAKAYADNASGSAGDVSVEYEIGCFCYDNSSGADEITASDIGNNCYIVDDETVAKTDGTETRSVAGEIVDVDAGGVWVNYK